MPAGILVRDVQRETARYYGVPVEIMYEPDGMGARPREKAWPRQSAMALAVRLTDKSLPHIGRIFKRDHTTILSGMRAAEARCLADDDTKKAMRAITLRLLGRC